MTNNGTNEPQLAAPKPANKGSKRRQKRADGGRLARRLIHVDKATRDYLRLMSLATSIPQIQLLNIAVSSLAQSNVLPELVAQMEAADAESRTLSK